MSEDGTVVDLWDEDSDSGRQRWSIEAVPGQEGVFHLAVLRGVEGGRHLLGAAEDGERVELTHADDGSGRQRWVFEDAPSFNGTPRYTIRVAGGANGDRVFLSCTEDGTWVDLWMEADDSGRQRWQVIGGEQPARAPIRFGIGGGEAAPLTHVDFEVPPRTVRASVYVVVDRVAPIGLNFFAIQVDFNNGTWAHGGLQTGDEQDGVVVRQINWGGLVDHGGGTTDYEQQNDAEDLIRIQNPPAGQHIGPYAWREGVAYEYVVERCNFVKLPPGDYRYFPGNEPVHLTRSRGMWEWRFTVRPVSTAGATFVATIYNSADGFDALCVWNESGYGSTDQEQHTVWSQPTYRIAGESTDRIPASWTRN